MQRPEFPNNESTRIAALCSLNVLDTPPEERFDRITRVAQRHFKTPMALVSLVDSDRQWFKSSQGLAASETPRDISFCGHAILDSGILYVPNALEDVRFADNPLVKGGPAIRFYAGAPLSTARGERIGTLCIIDIMPREFTRDELSVLRDLADCAEAELGRTNLLKAAQESHRLAMVAERTDNCVVITNTQGDIEWVNQGFERMTGYTLTEALNQTLAQLLYSGSIHSQEIQLMSEKFRLGSGFNSELLGKRKNGEAFWLSMNVQPITDDEHGLINFIGIGSDITERKQSEKKIQEGERQIRAIVNNVIDGIISIDAQGTIKTVNPATEHLFGYSAPEMLNCNVKMLMPEPYNGSHDRYVHNFLTTGERKIIGIGREVIGKRKDGSTFPMELAVSELEINGKRMFSGIVRDISERKKVERMKSEFISTISHELRTPLTSIRGAISLVLGQLGGDIAEKPRNLLEMAERNSQRLTLLINDILDWEKIESGRVEFEFKEVDLVSLARRALADNEGFVRKHGVRLRLISEIGSAPVRGDEHRLLQVLANLLSNAAKFSDKGDEIELTVCRHDAGYRVLVQDHGRGIPEEFHDQIFRRFAQADSSDSREKGGTGLGLSITKNIIECHEGKISYTSHVDEGTVFFFDLPAWQNFTEHPLAYPNTAHILICEDDPNVAKIITAMLKAEGILCDVAPTVTVARALLVKHPYRLLLLDLTLPDGDGLELIHELRSDPLMNQLSIIVVSGRAEEGRYIFKRDGVAVMGWLQKPPDQKRLMKMVQKVLGDGQDPRILYVEDDADIVQLVRGLLEEFADFDHAASLFDARQLLARKDFDLVILDLGLTDGSGIELLPDLKGRCPVIVFSAQHPSRESTGQVAAALTKSVTSNEELLETIKRILSI